MLHLGIILLPAPLAKGAFLPNFLTEEALNIILFIVLITKPTNVIFNQFASIGLVFTTKSIACYNKISESPTFAEYYLIGSLFSILNVLLSAWICLF